MHRRRVMTDGEIPRPAGILEKKKKNLLSLIPLIHVDVRENGTESSVKDARVQLTRENWPKETRYAKREPTPDRAAFESREGKRERAENGRKEKGRRENEKELDGETNEEREKERDIIRSWRQRWGEVKKRIRKGRRTEREEEKSRRVRVSSLVGTSYSFILKRPRKIASTVETVLFLLHTWIPGYTSGRLRNSLHSVWSCSQDRFNKEWKEMILRTKDRLKCFLTEFWEEGWKRKRFRKRGWSMKED